MGAVVSQRSLNSRDPVFDDDSLEGVSNKLPEIN